MADELNIATLALGADDDVEHLDAETEQIDAIRSNVLDGDAKAFVATLAKYDLLAVTTHHSPLVYLMDWFHTWQQEYEAFVHVLDADNDNDDADSNDEASNERDLEEMEAEAEMLLDGFSAIAIALLDTLAITDVDAVLDRNGWTLLMQAANAGLRTLVDVLVAHGADVNATGATHDATNALYLAVENEHTDEAMVLLAHGAVASATKRVKTHAVSFSDDKNDNDDNDDDDAPVADDEDCALFQACRFGHLSVLDALVANGVDLHFALPTSGDTALHVAVMFEMLDVVELLLRVATTDKTRVDVNATNASGQTCLFGCSSVDIAQLLVANGVDPKIQDAELETAFSVADALGDEQVADFLKTCT